MPSTVQFHVPVITLTLPTPSWLLRGQEKKTWNCVKPLAFNNYIVHLENSRFSSGWEGGKCCWKQEQFRKKKENSPVLTLPLPHSPSLFCKAGSSTPNSYHPAGYHWQLLQGTWLWFQTVKDGCFDMFCTANWPSGMKANEINPCDILCTSGIRGGPLTKTSQAPKGNLELLTLVYIHIIRKVFFSQSL